MGDDDLRWPLALDLILQRAFLLLEGIAGTLPTRAAEMIDPMALSAQHLCTLLDLGRLDAGKVQLTLEDVALPALPAPHAHLARARRCSKGLALELDAADVPHVRTDAQRVQQIVLNLVSNAVKFTERGGVRIWCNWVVSTFSKDCLCG